MHKENLHCLLCGTLLTEQISWLTLIQTFPTTICTKCEAKFEPYTNTEPDHRALYTYNEVMKDYLHRYKFMHDVVLAKVFQKQLHNVLRNEKRMIIPIPMHPEKLVDRTFSPIDELLIAAKLPYEHVLEKTTTTSQSTKSREERLNTPQLFRIKGHVKHTDYVIFDDIYTTGTTMNHAKKALLEAGAKSVTAVTLIHG
ncbi:ComF family protein [Lysinibacillus sp. KU-BSD001]|uniref:ComF family protein n=1 Tax=Lysinibacillus sp. KU-BSD001 TaxID=3141328 RepID=UPI0036EE60B0